MNKKRLLPLLMLFMLSVGLYAQQKQYKRIISLVPSLTESIYYLDAQSKLIGCTSYCTIAKDDNKEIVASAVKPNIEKIVKLKPDLVLVSGLTDPKDIATFKKFGIAVEMFQTPKSFEEICQQFVDMGVLVGNEQNALRVVKESKEKVDRIRSQLKWNVTPKIFFQIGADPIFAVLSDTFMDDYITFLGGKNIAANLKQGTVGREFVMTQNPDFIVIAAMGIVGEEEKIVWSKYTNLSAAKNNRIFIIPAEIACQPTPIAFVKTMEELVKFVTKKIEKK